MTKVKIEQLQPGMVAESDLTNMDGMLLLPAGCTLTERHIRILQTWGITEVPVQTTNEPGAAPGSTVAMPPELAPELVAHVKARFWHYQETNPVHQEILRLLVSRKARQPRPA